MQAETVKAGGDRRKNAPTIHDDIMNDAGGTAKQGTSSAYLLRRLARAAPDTLAAYESGALPSARAAAKAAGIPVADGPG